MKSICKLFAVLVALVGQPWAIWAQNGPIVHDFKSWPDMVAKYLDAQSVAGYSFIARSNGLVVAARVGDYARMPWEKTAPAMPWTALKMMPLASVSKPITASAIMKLWEDKHGAFSLDDAAWPWVKDLFPNATALSRQITIRQLLTHRSGLNEFLHNYNQPKELAMMAETLASPTNSPPGSAYHYNNANFYLLRLVLERISGQPYTQYVRTHILIPTGAATMNTVLNDPVPVLMYKSGSVQSPGQRWGNERDSAGATGWFGSTLDLTAFLYGISNGSVLSKSTAEMMFQQGLGWFSLRVNGRKIGVFHEGEQHDLTSEGDITGGFHSIIAHCNDGVDIAILVNSENARNLPKLVSQLCAD